MRVHRLASVSDIIIAGRLDAAELHQAHPAATLVAISPFGLGGPREGDCANDFLLQALSGSFTTTG